MKLHLPKALFAAVLMAGSAAYADTGWEEGYKFYIGGDQAGHLDNSINTGYSVTPDDAETADIDERVTTIEVVDATGKTGTLQLWADDRDSNYAPTNALIGELKVAAGTTLEAGTNSWGSSRIFDKLTIDKISVTNKGATTLNVTHTGHKVEVASVDGSLSSISNVGTLTLGTEGSSINLGGTITNTGTMTVNGAINVTNLANFAIAQEGSTEWSDADNQQGFIISNGSTYTLATGGVTFAANAVNDNGTMREITTIDGTTTFVGGSVTGNVYHVISQDVTTSAAGLEGAVAYDIAEGRTVTIAGGSDVATAAGLLSGSTGDGNIILQTSVDLGTGHVTKATGSLTIAEGVTINLGSGEGTTPSLASFTSMVIDGGSINVNCKTDTWTDVIVTTKGAGLHVEDLNTKDTPGLTFAGSTTLEGDLTISSRWGTIISFEALTGNGSIVVDDDSRDEGLTINLGNTNNYTGKVHIKQSIGNLTVNVSDGSGVNMHYENISARELNLQTVVSGYTATLQGVTAYLTKDSVINANIELLNTSTKAGLEINDGYSNSTNTFNGKVLGTGNLVINKEGITNVTQKFTGDVSDWTGRLDIAGGTDNKIVFTGNATEINNSMIETRKDAARTNDVKATVTFDHDKAATINAELKQSANSTFDLVVNNSSTEGATFKKAVNVSSTTLGAGTTATFEANANLGDLTLGAGATVTATGDLTIGALTLDLEAYTTDYTTHTLVSTTGTLTFTGDLSGYQDVLVGDYTATITNTGSSLVLSFVTLPSEPNSLSVTGVTGCVEGLLTLTVNADLLNYDFTNDGAIIIPGIDDSIMSDIRNLTTLPEDGMVGIALQGTDGGTITATADGQIGFLGKDGESVYYGEAGSAGWQYNANYIPEPATATLSLLALAALAARRRRRA